MKRTVSLSDNNDSERETPQIPSLYENYSQWKGWVASEGAGNFAATFAAEFRRAQVAAGARILDIGFGGGEFLDWARAQGYRVVGTELLPALVDAVRERGHEAYCGTLAELAGGFAEPFDVVTFWDVLEHLPKREIVEYLMLIRSLLRPGGRLIARCPNCASTAGMVNYANDLTHETMLSCGAAGQLALLTGYTVVYAGNAARGQSGPQPPVKRTFRLLAHSIRDILELVFGVIYFGRRVPLDAEITFILRY
jgi:2-polyprenyl-3-methyl-5-hydroxy-6-metoxy-1,4-benzoquinol methylase